MEETLAYRYDANGSQLYCERQKASPKNRGTVPQTGFVTPATTRGLCVILGLRKYDGFGKHKRTSLFHWDGNNIVVAPPAQVNAKPAIYAAQTRLLRKLAIICSIIPTTSTAM